MLFHWAVKWQPRAFPIKRNSQGRYSFTFHFSNPRIAIVFLELEAEPPLAPAAAIAAMAPKVSKGKATKVGESKADAKKIDVVELRKKHIVFAPALDKSDLIREYAYMWGRKTKAHDAPHVLPASVPASSDKLPFFIAYLYRGLCPLFSDFFNDIMYTYGFRLLDFTPNAVMCMTVFAHLCEN